MVWNGRKMIIGFIMCMCLTCIYILLSGHKYYIRLAPQSSTTAVNTNKPPPPPPPPPSSAYGGARRHVYTHLATSTGPSTSGDGAGDEA